MPVGGGRLAFSSSSNSHIPKTRCKNPEFGDCFFGKSFHIFPPVWGDPLVPILAFGAFVTFSPEVMDRILLFCWMSFWGSLSSGDFLGAHVRIEACWTWLNKSLGVGYTLPLSDFFLLDKREDFGQVIILLWCYPNGMLPLPVTVTTGLSYIFQLEIPVIWLFTPNFPPLLGENPRNILQLDLHCWLCSESNGVPWSTGSKNNGSTTTFQLVVLLLRNLMFPNASPLTDRNGAGTSWCPGLYHPHKLFLSWWAPGLFYQLHQDRCTLGPWELKPKPCQMLKGPNRPYLYSVFLA